MKDPHPREIFPAGCFLTSNPSEETFKMRLGDLSHWSSFIKLTEPCPLRNMDKAGGREGEGAKGERMPQRRIQGQIKSLWFTCPALLLTHCFPVKGQVMECVSYNFLPGYFHISVRPKWCNTCYDSQVLCLLQTRTKGRGSRKWGRKHCGRNMFFPSWSVSCTIASTSNV